MRIITKKLKLQPNERFVLCDNCNTSFVVEHGEALSRIRDFTFDDEPTYDYTFACPSCGLHCPVFGVLCDDEQEGTDCSSDNRKRHFLEFLELPESKRFETVFGCKLKWYQRFEFFLANFWFSMWQKANPKMRARDLWESIYKQRF